jgi:putative proteasome-type protease
VDYISTYSKLHVFQPAPDRLFVLMAAGNLATTQAVLNRIRRDLAPPVPTAASHMASSGVEAAPVMPLGPDLRDSAYLFEAADYIGQLSVQVQRTFSPSLREAGATGEASFILGGQIAGQPHGLFLIYPQGNAVMATRVNMASLP